jgi:hypothetical protein
MEILEILREDLNEMINVEVYTETPSESSETDVEVSISLMALSSEQIKDSLRGEFNKIVKDGFSYFWKKVPSEQRKRKESCRKLFSRLCNILSSGNQTTESYLKDLDFKIKEFINEYEKFDKKEPYLPYGYLENIITSMTVYTD